MRNCIEYVLKEQKVSDGLVYMSGPSPDEISWDTVYQSFLEEKKLWNKDVGRMYNHNIISFHKDEAITPEQALEFGKAFTDKWFSNYQTLVAVHQDRDHIHIHFVTNTVSYMDGKKLHNTKFDLQRMKDFTNELCKERGLTVAEKGKHFDGSEIEEGTTIAWFKDKYHLMGNEKKKSYVVECAIAVLESREKSCNKEEFERSMEERGWHVIWKDKKKHITFKNDIGDKVRDSNLFKTFSMNISKESLLYEFERQNEIRLAKLKADRDRAEERVRAEQFDKYYAEVEAAIQGNKTFGGAIEGTEASHGRERQSLIRDIRAEQRDQRSAERQSVEKRKDSLTERNHREIERERSRIEEERIAREKELRAAKERAVRQRRSRDYDWER